VVLRGYSLELKLGLVFLLNLHSNHLLMKNPTLVQKRGNIPTQISSQILKPLLYDFLGSFAFRGNSTTTTHLPHGFTPTSTCLTKTSNGKCLGYVAFECHGIFKSIGSHLHIGINKKTCLGYDAPKPRSDKCQASIHGLVPL
jgi:hypothetical protein